MPHGAVSRDGPIEVNFASGTKLLLDAGPDGEELRVRTSAWVDPFSEPLSAANRTFVEEEGKWMAFDVSEETQFSHLIGQSGLSVSPVTSSGATLS